MEITRQDRFKVIFAIFGAVTVIAFTTHHSSAIADTEQLKHLAKLITLAGISAGWLLGFIATPTSNREQERFRGYAAAISSFVGGFGLSEVTNLIRENVDSTIEQVWIVQFLICTAMTAISIYMVRLRV